MYISLCFSCNVFPLLNEFCRTAGSVLGTGFQAFISDWDKVSATVCEHSDSFTRKMHL